MAKSGGFEGLKARSATGSTADLQMMAKQIETIISQSEKSADETTSDNPQKTEVMELLTQILPLLSAVMKQDKSAAN